MAGTVLALALAGCGAGGAAADGDGSPVVIESRSSHSGPYAGVEIDPPFPMPEVTLTDQAGATTRVPTDLDGAVRVFFFGYTHCPDVCPLIMADLALAVARLPADVAAQVEVVLVTSDPARDDPQTLRAYLDRFDPGFSGLTGDLDTIMTMAETMGVPVEQGRRLPSGGFEVGHGAQLVGYAGNAGMVVWTEGVSAEDLAADLVVLADQEG